MKKSEATSKLWNFIQDINNTDEDIMYFMENTLGMLPPSRKVGFEEAAQIENSIIDTKRYQYYHKWDEENEEG